MPADDPDTLRATLGETVRINALRARPIDPGARTSAHLLGYQFRPGDLIIDSVTGQEGTVTHATETTVVAAGQR